MKNASILEVEKLIQEHQYPHITVGVFDLDGVLRGKRISKEKCLKALHTGLGVCDVVLGWDIEDRLYEQAEFTGWHTGYPDAKVALDPSTLRTFPFDEKSVLILGDFQEDAAQLCPRNQLKRTLTRAQSMGLMPYCAFEYEFFLFKETPQSLQEKQFRDLKPLTPGAFGYSVLRSSVYSEFHQDLLNLCQEMNFELEGLHTESGPGVIEAAIGVDHALEAADKAALFKTFCKVLAQKHGFMATFMARWSTQFPGQSGHIHLSLKNAQGQSVFFDGQANKTISTTMQQFIAGQIQLMPEFTALYAPTVNAYTRLVPGFWAPTQANWGIENRTCALRAILGEANAQRVECRVPGADCNPYLALNAALASGLWGIEQQLDPVPEVKGNGYQRDPAHVPLATHLFQGAQSLNTSKVARELFGNAFVDHFVSSRMWEAEQASRQVTDWQLKRYFEAI